MDMLARPFLCILAWSFQSFAIVRTVIKYPTGQMCPSGSQRMCCTHMDGSFKIIWIFGGPFRQINHASVLLEDPFRLHLNALLREQKTHDEKTGKQKTFLAHLLVRAALSLVDQPSISCSIGLSGGLI